MYDNRDLIFFTLILSFEKRIEKAHDKTFEYEFNFAKKSSKKGDVEVKIGNKKEIKRFFTIGEYDDKTEIFSWNDSIRNFINSLFESSKSMHDFFNGFGSCYKKLFGKSKIKIKKEYKNVIPYLVLIMVNSFDLYRVTTKENEDNTLYLAIDLKLTKPMLNDFLKKIDKLSPLLYLLDAAKHKPKRQKKNSKKGK